MSTKIPGHKYFTTKRPCSHRRDKKDGAKDLPEPQLPEEERPKHWMNVVLVPDISGFKCLLCGEKKEKYNTLQQHCKKHFPPTFHCLDCGDSFHLRTEYNNHFDDFKLNRALSNKEKTISCEFCCCSVQQKGLKVHYKSKKCKKAQNELLKKTMNAWKTKMLEKRRRCIRIEPKRRPKLKLKPRLLKTRVESE